MLWHLYLHLLEWIPTAVVMIIIVPLNSLCFVCGCLIKKVDKFYVVSSYLDFLAKGLRCSELFELDGITPTKFCRSCYSAFSHINNGGTVKTKKTLIE